MNCMRYFVSDNLGYVLEGGTSSRIKMFVGLIVAGFLFVLLDVLEHGIKPFVIVFSFRIYSTCCLV